MVIQTGQSRTQSDVGEFAKRPIISDVTGKSPNGGKNEARIASISSNDNSGHQNNTQQTNIESPLDNDAVLGTDVEIIELNAVQLDFVDNYMDDEFATET